MFGTTHQAKRFLWVTAKNKLVTLTSDGTVPCLLTPTHTVLRVILVNSVDPAIQDSGHLNVYAICITVRIWLRTHSFITTSVIIPWSTEAMKEHFYQCLSIILSTKMLTCVFNNLRWRCFYKPMYSICLCSSSVTMPASWCLRNDPWMVYLWGAEVCFGSQFRRFLSMIRWTCCF